MIVKLSQVITNKDGVELKVQAKEPLITTQEDGTEIQEFKLVNKIPTVGLLIEQCLLQKTQTLCKEEIIARYDLFLKIQGKEEIELTEEELKLIDELIASRYDTFTAGKTYELIYNV